ncbi:MAG: hypothetical protein LIP08_03755 [Bacteroides sp.]|nr:hypothetical protein [Bacteroides sp.]
MENSTHNTDLFPVINKPFVLTKEQEKYLDELDNKETVYHAESHLPHKAGDHVYNCSELIHNRQQVIYSLVKEFCEFGTESNIVALFESIRVMVDNTVDCNDLKEEEDISLSRSYAMELSSHVYNLCEVGKLIVELSKVQRDIKNYSRKVYHAQKGGII